MTSYVALLRAVNLAGLNKVAMGDLRALAESLGLANPRTLLQSGNLVFGGTGAPARLEKSLRDAAGRKLGIETDFFVRSAAEWKEIVKGNPFPREAERDPGHLVVLACSKAPDRAGIKALEEAIPGHEVIRAAKGAGRHAYVVYPDGIGRSRLTSALIERKLGLRCTARNWNTVLKLMAILDEAPPPRGPRTSPAPGSPRRTSP